ncbi:hypothetical protein M8C21_019047, partial [Ambrosia artemisiifolia]
GSSHREKNKKSLIFSRSKQNAATTTASPPHNCHHPSNNIQLPAPHNKCRPHLFLAVMSTHHHNRAATTHLFSGGYTGSSNTMAALNALKSIDVFGKGLMKFTY